jgi:hypothetical protein
MASNNYQIQLTDKCRQRLAEIESLDHIDEALAGIYRLLAQNPYAFGFVPPLAEMRFVKTRLYVGDDFVIPPLTLFFKIYEDDQIVKILDVYPQKGFGDVDEDF